MIMIALDAKWRLVTRLVGLPLEWRHCRRHEIAFEHGSAATAEEHFVPSPNNRPSQWYCF
jgi:hypothetical protein